MASKPARDWIYLFIITVQLFGMIALDLVSFYPPALWQAPTAPLHFLVTLRKTYVSSSGDPFFAGTTQHQPWFAVFLWIELLAQFPLAAFLVFRLARSSKLTGAGELAGLAFGCLTFMGSAACCAELWHMGEELVSAEKWTSLFYGTYLPFVIIPAVLAVDMYIRLLGRVQEPTKFKSQ